MKGKVLYELCLLHLLFQHMAHRRDINRISRACAYLTRKGVFRRVARGKYVLAEKSPPIFHHNPTNFTVKS